jgi:hypothetical protein
MVVCLALISHRGYFYLPTIFSFLLLGKNSKNNIRLRPEDRTVPSNFKDLEPKSVVEAYHHSSTINPTLAFLVPVTAVLSLIPACLAFSHSASESGTTSDSDFWQTVSSSIIQILSVVTLVTPTIFNVRLAKMAWFWTWVLAVVSICCSVVAPPLYLNLSTKWSTIVSFVGSLTPVFITLQLMFEV